MSSSSPPDLPASPELDSAEPAPGLWRRIFGDIDWQPPGLDGTDLRARVRASPPVCRRSGGVAVARAAGLLAGHAAKGRAAGRGAGYRARAGAHRLRRAAEKAGRHAAPALQRLGGADQGRGRRAEGAAHGTDTAGRVEVGGRPQPGVHARRRLAGRPALRDPTGPGPHGRAGRGARGRQLRVSERAIHRSRWPAASSTRIRSTRPSRRACSKSASRTRWTRRRCRAARPRWHSRTAPASRCPRPRTASATTSAA